MKIKLNSKTFVSDATVAASAQKQGVLIPILENLLLEEKNGKLTITGSDMETTTVVETETDAPEGLNVALPVKGTLDLLKSIGNTEVELTFEENKVIIKTFNGKFDLATFPGSEFPRPKVDGVNDSFKFKGSTLEDVINTVGFAAANDDLKPVLSGMLMDVKEDEVVFVATNGHKLVKRTFKGALGVEPVQLVLPQKALAVVKKRLGDAVEVSYNNSNAVFKSGGVTTYARLVEGRYPPYDKVIPTENPNKVEVGSFDLTETLKRVSLFSNQTTKTVKFVVDGGGMEVSAIDLDNSTSANETVQQAKYEGQPLTIGFNAKYLLEVLGSTDFGSINVSMSEPNKPAIITDSNKEGYLALVMPTVL